MTKKAKAKVAIRNAYEHIRMVLDGPFVVKDNGTLRAAMHQLDIAEEYLSECERTCCNQFCDDCADEETEE